MKEIIETQYAIGQVVKHKYLDFRGVIYDVDPEFNNTEEWYQSIPPAIRPIKEQPFYHVFAENDQVFYCLLYTSPSPRDRTRSRMPSSA